jgi:RND family efflux transporter MFP subunit
MKYIYWITMLPLLLSACSKDQKVTTAPIERPAYTVVVESTGEDQSNEYSGDIRARYETSLGFRIGGKIIERTVDVGALVKKGQILAKLDAADSGLQATSANAQLRLAEDEAKRYRELRDKGFVSQSVLDAKETSLNSAAAQAGLALNQQSYSSLLADRDGVVSATLAEVGQVVTAGQTVVRLAQDGKREVAIAIPETSFNSVRVGMSAQVNLNAIKNGTQNFPGHVREISPAADPASRTYAVRISLDKDSASVALGMTASVKINTNTKTNTHKNIVSLIPLSAIFQQGEQTAVWIVAADHSVSLRPVVVKTYLDEGALISSGITAGERIISAGVHMINAGEKIKMVDNGITQ